MQDALILAPKRHVRETWVSQPAGDLVWGVMDRRFGEKVEVARLLLYRAHPALLLSFALDS